VNPRLASPPLHSDPDRARAASDTRGWRWFALALNACGLGVGVVLVVSGQRVTGAGAFLVLAALLALAVNRYAFFPSELAVTAEVAVLLAAVVGFGLADASRGNIGAGGSLLAPWCLGLLAGPLDILHWRQRSYVRMAYNAGNRMAATLLAAVAFSAVLGTDPSPSFGTIAVGGLAASAAFAVVEVVVGTVLVRLRTGAAWVAAARVELPMEALTIPLGLLGAVAGALGAEVGWWLAPLMLVPAIFVPELVLVARLPRRAPLGWVAMVGFAVVALALSAPLASWPPPASVVGLAMVALLLGIELRAGVRAPVPALVSLGVAAAVVVSSDAEVLGAVGVAVVATTVTWALERTSRWWAVPLAAGAALAADVAFDLRPSRATALGAAILFQLLVWTRADRVVWTAPLVCVAVSAAFAWHALGNGGAALFISVLAVVLALVSAVGAAPWNSRIVASWLARRHVRLHRSVLAALVIAALASSVTGVAARSQRDLLVPIASVCAGAIAAVAMNAVRQWRFAPARRTGDAAAVFLSAVAVAALYPPAGLDGQAWSVAVLTAAVAVCTAVAWPLVRRASTAATQPALDHAGRVDLPVVRATPGASGRGTRRSPPRS
jgi:hypothetical protein